MADVRELFIKGATSSVNTCATAAASYTIPLDETDHRAVLVINNRNADVIVRANLAAGDMGRECLGALDVDIAASSWGAIPLTDSMRHKVNSTGKATVNLRDTSDTALTATPYGLVDVMLIQG